jgi:hypothetical protein
MATLERYEQLLDKSESELDEAKVALTTFQGSKYGEEKLNELREKEASGALDAREKTWLDTLVKEEGRLKDAVEACRKVWMSLVQDLREARAQPGNDFVFSYLLAFLCLPYLRTLLMLMMLITLFFLPLLALLDC